MMHFVDFERAGTRKPLVLADSLLASLFLAVYKRLGPWWGVTAPASGGTPFAFRSRLVDADFSRGVAVFLRSFGRPFRG